MATYSVTANLDPDDFTKVSQAGYHLCITKQVNGRYYVVWKSVDDYYQITPFQWQSEEFQVFGSVKSGRRVEFSTDTPNIKFGETCTLDKNGVMLPAHGPSDPESGLFHVQNNFGPIFIGANAKLLRGDKWLPVYLSDQPCFNGNFDLVPVEKVLIWFDLTSSTCDIIQKPISNCIEVDFTQSTAPQAVEYTVTDPTNPGEGRWKRIQ